MIRKIQTSTAKFTLVSAQTTRSLHQGLVVNAFYRQDPENSLELTYKITLFNRWPPIKLNADLVDYPLNGIYEYPNGRRIDCLHLFCPKTQDGLFLEGFSPAEQVARKLQVLSKVEV